MLPRYNRLFVLGASLLLAAGCGSLRKQSPSSDTIDWTELGAAESRDVSLPPEARPLGDFLTGILALTAGDDKVALEALRDAVLADPNSGLLRRRLASLYVRQEMLPEARIECQAAVRLDPDNVEGRLMLADVSSTLGEDDKAIREYEDVLALDPENEQARLLLGVLYAKQQRLRPRHRDPAVPDRIDPPTRSSATTTWAASTPRRRTSTSAEEAYKTALKHQPAVGAGADRPRAAVRERASAPTRPSSSTSRCCKANPRRRNIRRRLGGLYARQRKFDDALAQFRELEKVDTDAQDTRTKIGLILLETGDYDRAANEFSLVLGAEPDNARVRYYLASIYEQSGNVRPRHRGVPAHPARPRVVRRCPQRMIAHLLQQRGELERAATAIEAARKLKPDDEDLIDVQAVLYRARAAVCRSRSSLMEQLVAAHPDNDRYHFTLGALYDENKDKDALGRAHAARHRAQPRQRRRRSTISATPTPSRACSSTRPRALIRRALAISPHDGFYVDSLGWVYYQRGDYDKAIEHLERAVALADDDPTIAEHLGDAYQQAGRTADALRIYRDALSRAKRARTRPSALRGKIDESAGSAGSRRGDS